MKHGLGKLGSNDIRHLQFYTEFDLIIYNTVLSTETNLHGY